MRCLHMEISSAWDVLQIRETQVLGNLGLSFCCLVVSPNTVAQWPRATKHVYMCVVCVCVCVCLFVSLSVRACSCSAHPDHTWAEVCFPPGMCGPYDANRNLCSINFALCSFQYPKCFVRWMTADSATPEEKMASDDVGGDSNYE